MNDETWGYAIAVIAIVGGGYWAYSHYEIKERGQAPTKIAIRAPAAQLPRPVGIVELGPDKNGAVWKVDADSVRGPPKERQGWTIIDASKDKTETYRERRILYQVDCGSTAARELSSATYDAGGRNVSGESTTPEKAKVEYWPPRTFGAAVVNFLCDARFNHPNA